MSSVVLLRAAFVIALGSTLGSLFFSEILKYPPCSLCWYQRLFMFPLVFVLGVALWASDDRWQKYGAPFAFVGFATALYHNLLYYGVIPEAIAPCMQGVSCTSKQLELFGFLTIPLLSLSSFAILAFIHVLALRTTRRIDEGQ